MAVCVGTVVMGAQVSIKTFSEVQLHVGVPIDRCQIPRAGNGVGTVTRSCPVGRSTVVSVIVGRQGLESTALNVGLVALELGEQGLGLTKKDGLVQFRVFISCSISRPLLSTARSQHPRRHRPWLQTRAAGCLDLG